MPIPIENKGLLKNMVMTFKKGTIKKPMDCRKIEVSLHPNTTTMVVRITLGNEEQKKLNKKQKVTN